MPRVTVGNEDHLKTLSADDLKLLSQTVRMEIIRRRVQADPNVQAQSAKIDGRVKYVSREDAEKVLRPFNDSERKAVLRASRLWGELFTETCYGMIDMEGYCTFCKVTVRKRQPQEPWVTHRIGCPSRADNRARTLVFTRRSLLSNYDAIMALSSAMMPEWVKDDYQRVVDALRAKQI